MAAEPPGSPARGRETVELTRFDPGKLKLVWDFLVLSGGQLLAKFLGFFAFAYLARTLGLAAYGHVEYVMALAAFFTMLVDAGLGPVAVRELSAQRAEPKLIAANVALARLSLVVISVPAMVLTARLSEAGAHLDALVWLFALSLAALPWRLDWLLQGREMMTRASAAQLIRMVAFTLCVMVAIHGPNDLVRVGWAECIAAGVTAVYYVVTQQLAVGPVSLRGSAAGLRDLVREGLPVGSSQMVAALNLYAPTFLVGTLVGGSQTAWFGASHRIVISLSIFSVIYHFNLYPTLTRLLASDRSRADALVGASFRVVAWVGIGGALLLMLLGPVVLQLAFGERFSGALAAYQVLVWFLPVSILSGHARWLLVASRRQAFVLVGQLIAAVTTVALGIPLIRGYGAVGAAVAMVLAALGLWVGTHVFALRTVGTVPGLASSLVPSALALAIGGGSHYARLNPWLSTLAGGALFFGLAPLVDRKLIRDLKHLARVKSEREQHGAEVQPGAIRAERGSDSVAP